MTTNPLRVARTGAPEPASTCQREIVLELLRAAGRAGINRDCFLMGSGPCFGHRMTQVGARLDELETEGFVFESFKAADTDRFVTYRLISEPVSRAERPKFRTKKRKAGAAAHVEPAPIEHQPPATLRQDQAPAPAHVEAFRREMGINPLAGDHVAVDAALAQFGPDCIGANVYGEADGKPILTATLGDLKQPGLFAEPPASYRDPESQT